jgi:hypothetical protein
MAIMFWFMRTQTEGIIINRGNQYCLGNENSKDQRDLKENENRILVWWRASSRLTSSTVVSRPVLMMDNRLYYLHN